MNDAKFQTLVDGEANQTPLDRDQILCKLVIQKKLISREQAEKCIKVANQQRKAKKHCLAEQIMIKNKLISSEIISEIYANQGRVVCPKCREIFSNLPPRIPETFICAKCNERFTLSQKIRDLLQISVSQSQDPLCGESIDKYKIEKLLGRGGMGAVYLAQDKRLIRPVAIKILSTELASQPLYIKRFLREARLAGQANHQNLVQIYDVGHDKHYFIAMEFVSGASLEAIIEKQGPLALKQALQILEGACKGLGVLHKLGVIHRDIKPDNLLVSSEGIVKLTDFGLAKYSQDQKLTATGALMGTPHFMSPEQCQGNELDHRSDIYSLGMTFYYMLTGKTPYTASHLLATLNKHVNEPPPPIQRKIPPGYNSLYLRMVAKKPHQRFQTTAEIVDAIQIISSKGTLNTKRISNPKISNKVVKTKKVSAVENLGQTQIRTDAGANKTLTSVQNPKKDSSIMLAVIAGILGFVIFLGFMIKLIISPSKKISQKNPQLAMQQPTPPKKKNYSCNRQK